MSANEILDDQGEAQAKSGKQSATAQDDAAEIVTKVAEHAKPKQKANRSVDIDDSEDQETTQKVVTAKSKNHDDQLSGKKVRVTFFDQNEEEGDKPIFASLNGYAYQIPRGVPVDIPRELLEVFENSKTTLITTGHAGEVKQRITNRFQYSVHGSR